MFPDNTREIGGLARDKREAEAQVGKEAEAQGLRRWMRRRPRMVLLLVNLMGILLVLVVAEYALRGWGMVPGYLDMGHADFHPLPKGESLRVSQEFYTGDDGIYRALPDSFLRRPGYHVNSWGFRGPEPDLGDSVRPRLMLIGDSFTWGAHADPIDSSYADLIRRPDVQVFNFGIPGTDPDQYQRVAETFIPRVEPDAVFLFFYMANDAMSLPHDVGPRQNCYHITQIGWLNAFLDGGYIGGPEETYRYYLDRFNVPPHNAFNRFCARTVIGTRFWQVLDRLGWVNSTRTPEIEARKARNIEQLKSKPYSGGHLRAISSYCAGRGIPFRLFFIPAHTAIERPDTASEPRLLGGLPYLYPEGLTADDYYGRPDGHYNNAGHRKMAALVKAEMERIFPSPKP